MKKFSVQVTSSSLHYLEVEAEDMEAARKIAKDTDGADFDTDPAHDLLDITDIQEIEDERG